MDNEKLDRLGMLLLDMIDEHDELCAMQEQLARHGSLSADAACVLRRIPIYHDLGLVPAAEGMAYHSVQLKEYTRKLRTARESFLETITDGIKKFWNAILNFFRRLFGGEEKMIEDTTAHLKKELEKKEKVEKKTPPPAKEERASEEEAKEEDKKKTFKGLSKASLKKAEDFSLSCEPVDFKPVLKRCQNLVSSKTKEECNTTMLSIAKLLTSITKEYGRTFEVDERMMLRAMGDFGIKKGDMVYEDISNADTPDILKNLETIDAMQKQLASCREIIKDLDSLRAQSERYINDTDEEIVKLKHRCTVSTVNAIRTCMSSMHWVKRVLLTHYSRVTVVL